jgi:hypothetical protein
LLLPISPQADKKGTAQNALTMMMFILNFIKNPLFIMCSYLVFGRAARLLKVLLEKLGKGIGKKFHFA